MYNNNLELFYLFQLKVENLLVSCFIKHFVVVVFFLTYKVSVEACYFFVFFLILLTNLLLVLVKY